MPKGRTSRKRWGDDRVVGDAEATKILHTVVDCTPVAPSINLRVPAVSSSHRDWASGVRTSPRPAGLGRSGVRGKGLRERGRCPTIRPAWFPPEGSA